MVFNSIPTVAAAMMNAFATNADKYIISRQNIRYKLYLVASFLILSAITLPLFIFFGEIKPEAIKPLWIVLLLIAIGLGSVINLLYYFVLQHEKITEIEPIVLLAPLFTILLASIVFVEERNPLIILLAVIASITLVWAHVKKEHIKFHKRLLPLIGYSVLIAPLGAILTRKLLTIYNPFAYEFIMNASIFVLLFFVLRPRWQPLHKKNPLWIIFTNILWAASWLLVFFSYIWIGVIRTTLIMTLAPLLVYVFARIFLKEKIYWKNIFALVVILICVTIAQVMNGG
jgi:drug/metabolite transporter (DMT)-like permease